MGGVQYGPSTPLSYAVVAKKGHEMRLAYSPLMALPQELRTYILSFVADGIPHWLHYPRGRVRLNGPDGLPPTTKLDNHMLQLETIYVALRHQGVLIDSNTISYDGTPG